MPVQDRTNEFRACVESIRNRSSFPQRGAEAKQRLLPNGKGPESKSEFSRMASSIAKEISSTTIKLGKLAQREFLHLSWLRPGPNSEKWQNGRRCSMIDQ